MKKIERYNSVPYSIEDPICVVKIEELDQLEKTCEELVEALEEVLDDCSCYYELFPNSHRKTFEEYFEKEIKVLKKIKGE